MVDLSNSSIRAIVAFILANAKGLISWYIYYITFSSICQEVFEKFFKKFFNTCSQLFEQANFLQTLARLYDLVSCSPT